MLDFNYLYYTEERMKYMEQIQAEFGKEHCIERRKVYQDVLDLYRENEIVNECPIYITFKGERAVDNGGVQRDMLSSFWEVAYNTLFEGANLLTPMIHPQTDLDVFPIIGRILSHGYLVTGILPVRIALPTLICMLLGPAVSISKELLLDTFLDFVSAEERKTMQQALVYKEKDDFPNYLQRELENVLVNFACRSLPKPSTLLSVIEQVARYEFISKPAAAISMIYSGIPVSHREFWSRKSPDKMVELYRHLTLNSSKMIRMLHFPEACSPQQERVYGYLRTMIGNSSSNELRLLMRFITGSSVCSSDKITVELNGLSGFARRPIAHTCDCVIELPTAYSNYDDFYNDFCCIFAQTNDEFSWRMDAL